MIRIRALFILTAAAALLSGCALQPLYAGGGTGAVATALQRVAVAPIAGEAGWLVRAALEDRLRVARGADAPRYRIEIRLDDAIDGFGVRADDSVTRERRTLRARWQLVDTADGSTLIDATAGSDTGIDVVSSEYATIAAERTALERLAGAIADQITTRVALFARQRGEPGSALPGDATAPSAEPPRTPN